MYLLLRLWLLIGGAVIAAVAVDSYGQRQLADRDGVTKMADADGVVRIIAYAPEERSTGLFLAVGLDQRAMLEPLERQDRRGLLLLSGIATIAAAAAYLFHRLWLWRPLRRMAAAERDRAVATEKRIAGIFLAITDAVFEVDRSWRFTYLNPRAADLIAGDRNLVGATLWQVFPEAATSTFAERCRRAMTTQQAETFEVYFASSTQWFDVRAFPSPSGLAVYVRDITERKRAEAESARGNAMLESLLENAPVGFAFFDAEHRYVRINAELARINGLPAEAHLGRTIAELLPVNAEVLDPVLDEVFATGRRFHHLEIDGETPLAPGRRRHWLTGFYPVELAGERRLVGAVVMEITAQKEAETRLRQTAAALEAAKEEAERANAAKSTFLATASHDLRQPVQSLALFAAALDARLGDHPARAVLGHLTDAVEALRRLLDGLLDLSRLDAGVVEGRPEAFRLGALLRRLGAEYGVRALQDGLSLRVVPCDCLVDSDPALLERILRNLIENALRYTEQGRVLVGCRRRGERVHIEVIDTGSGIPADHLDDIFDEFHQLAHPARKGAQGLGLGLSIVKRLADLLGLTLSVDSVEGKGSRFSVAVRLAALTPVPARSAAGPTNGGTRQFAGLVAVIDDEAMLRTALRLQLELWGLTVVDAAAGAEAVAALRHLGRTPDLVIADYRLADRHTGLDAIEQIITKVGRPRHCLVLTGDTAAAPLAEIRRSGYPLLHKPVTPNDLRRVLERLLAVAE